MPISNHDLQLAIARGSGEGLRTAFTSFGQSDVETLPNDANATLTANSAEYQVTAAPITANRTVTLPTANVEGKAFHVVRTAASTGAFNLTVNGRALTAGQWVRVINNGSAWVTVASGSL